MAFNVSALIRPHPSTNPWSLVRQVGLWTSLTAGLLMAVIDPGLAPWINDEAKLLTNAWLANSTGWPAKTGLLGTQGYFYGPTPTWFYQLGLLITHNICVLVILHALIFYGATLTLGWFLVRNAGLSRLTLLLLAFMPSICFYSRQLWDNSFNIPLSCGLLGLYASYLSAPGRWKLRGLGAGCALAVGVHLSAITLVAAIVAHGVWTHRTRLRRWLVPFLTGAACVMMLHLPYLGSQISIFTGAMPKPMLENSGLVAGYPYLMPRQSSVESVWFAWTGSRVLTADFSIMPRFDTGPVGLVQQFLRWMTYPLYLCCILGVAGEILRNFRKKEVFTKQSSQTRVLILICFCVIFLNSLLFAVIRPVAMDHYFNGSFGAYVVLTSAGLSCTAYRWWKILIRVTIVCLAGYTCLCLLNLKQTQGRQLGYGPVLGEQLRILQEVKNQGVEGIYTDVIHFVFFPHALRTLWRLDPPAEVKSDPGLWPAVTPRDRYQGYLMIEWGDRSRDQMLPLQLNLPAQSMR